MCVHVLHILQVGCLILLDGGPSYFHSQFKQGTQAASKEEEVSFDCLVTAIHCIGYSLFYRDPINTDLQLGHLG